MFSGGIYTLSCFSAKLSRALVLGHKVPKGMVWPERTTSRTHFKSFTIVSSLFSPFKNIFSGLKPGLVHSIWPWTGYMGLIV